MPHHHDTKTALLLSAALTLLAAGGAIYLLFRPSTTLMHHLIGSTAPALQDWRSAAASDALCPAWATTLLPQWLREAVVYSLPNGLWSAAWILSVCAIHRNDCRRNVLLWAALIPMLGVASELLQAIGCCPGTFDWMDIVAYTLPYFFLPTLKWSKPSP